MPTGDEPKSETIAKAAAEVGAPVIYRHYHHCPCVPAADVAAGHGRQDVQSACRHHLHLAAGGAVCFGDSCRRCYATMP